MTTRDAIMSAGKAIADAINRRDAAACAALYTDDGAVLPPGAPRHDGRSGIQQFWQIAIDMGLGDVVLTTVEVEEVGDLAYEVGRLTGSVPGEGGARTPLEGKFIVVWRRGADGTWRLHRDIWNTDA